MLSSGKGSGRVPGGIGHVVPLGSPLLPALEMRWSHAAAGLVGDLCLAKLSLLSTPITQQHSFDEANFSLLHWEGAQV